MSFKTNRKSPSNDVAIRERDAPANASVAMEVSLRAAVRRLLLKRPIGRLYRFLRRDNFDEPILAAIVGHREILDIMRRPQLRVLTRKHPNMVYRPFAGYLATSFCKKQRRQIIKEHYLYLMNRLSESFFSQIARDKPLLWQKPIGQDTFAIAISFAGSYYEGDLLLEFQINGVGLYHLSFTIAPGYLVGSAAAQATLIARIQGVRGKFAAIRHATKACLDISPPHLLMAAIQGTARALNITCMAGVRSREQIMVNLQLVPQVYFDYDAFWMMISAIEAKNFWLMPVPLVERPIEEIDVTHRRRTRLKRQFKYEVQETIRSNFINAFFATYS